MSLVTFGNKFFLWAKQNSKFTKWPRTNSTYFLELQFWRLKDFFWQILLAANQWFNAVTNKMSFVTIDTKLFLWVNWNSKFTKWSHTNAAYFSFNANGEEGKSFIAHAAAGKLMIQCYNQLNKSRGYRQ